MLIPKKTKYRKSHRFRGKSQGVATKCNTIAFGKIALKATTAGEITSRQIEAARRAMTRAVKRGGKIWIRVFPHTPITRKSAEVPMGSGKGSIEFYISRIKKGTVLFEMEGVADELAIPALKTAGYKLPVKTKVLIKSH